MYEAWQQQQRAQKDEDRKAKSEAAAALQNYRRDELSEEETKLRALREQERLKKLEAESKLRGYRGQMTEEEARLAAQRQEELRKKQLMEEQLRNNGVVTAHDPGIHASLKGMENSGAVSAMAAQFASPQKEQQFPTAGTAITPQERGIPTGSQDDFVTDEAENGWPPETEPAFVLSKVDDHVYSEGNNAFDLPSNPPSVPSKVSFMFGIITSTEDPPQVDGYLARADQIVKTILVDHPNTFASLASTVSYPVVASLEKDHSRIDVHRTMVEVSIFFTASDYIIAKEFQDEVVEGIRIAIANGRFNKD